MNRATLGIDHLWSHACVYTHALTRIIKDADMHARPHTHTHTHTHTLTKITEDTDSDLGEPICIFRQSGDGPSVGHRSWNPTEVPVGNIHVPIAFIFHNPKWLFVTLFPLQCPSEERDCRSPPARPWRRRLCLSAALLVLPGAALCLELPYAGPPRALRIRRVQGASSGLREASACGGRRGSRAPSGRRGRRRARESRQLCPREARGLGGPTRGWAVAASEGPGPPPLLASQTHPPQQSLQRELFPPRTLTPIPALLGGAATEFLASGSEHQWWQRSLQ